MNDERPGAVIRKAIGGDDAAISWIVGSADDTDDALVVVMAALLEPAPARLARAQDLAVSSRDRQAVAIARAHLAGDSELVDALARDHLVTYPDSLIVSWIASDPGSREDPVGLGDDYAPATDDRHDPRRARPDTECPDAGGARRRGRGRGVLAELDPGQAGRDARACCSRSGGW